MGGRVLGLAWVGALLAACIGCSCSDEMGDARGGGVAARDAAAEPRARAAGEAQEPAEAAAQGAAAARPRHVLSGSVRTYDGRALAGAVIRAEPVAVFPHAPDPRTPSETTAGADGAFALPSLEAGDWSLLVSAEGALRTCAATVRVPERERFDIVLPRGSVIEGVVVDEATRAPVAGARVRLRGSEERWIGDVRTSPDGRFAMPLFAETRWYDVYRIDAQGYAREPAESSQAEVDSRVLGRHEVTLVAQRGHKLTGRVVGPDGTIAGARVTLEPVGGSDDPSDWHEATTDAAGRYEIEDLAEASSGAELHAEAAGWVQKGVCDPDVAGPGTPDSDDPVLWEGGWTAPDIEMRRRLPIGRCTIAGSVVDEEGHPVAGVALVTHHKAGAVRATSEADGSFLLADVPTEAKDGQVWILTVDGTDWDGSESVETQTGAAVRDVRVLVSPVVHQHVRGRVLAPDRTPGAGARVVAVVGAANQMHCFAPIDAVWIHGFEARTGADGTFDVELRFRGEDFALVVESAGAALWIREIPLSEAIAKPVEVVLEAPVAIAGRAVRRGTDAGIAGLSVSLVRVVSPDFTDSDETFPDARVVATTAADGSFRVEGLSLTTDSLRIGGPGWIDAKAEFDADAPTASVRVEVAPALEITGRAQFADGRPCGGVVVTVCGANPDPSDEDRPAAEDDDQDPFSATLGANPDGTFSSGPIAPGRYWLEFKGGTPQVIRRVAGPFDAGTRDVVVDLVRGVTIRGRVFRPGGRPVDRVTVTAWADGRDGTNGEATPDDSGVFAIGGLDGGPHNVRASAEGCFDWTKSGVRADGDPVEIRLDEGLVVAGVVHSADGSEARYRTLVVEPVDAAEPAEARTGQTDSDGRFRIAMLTRGRWRLRCKNENDPETFPDVIVEAGDASLELRTSPRPPAPPAEEPPADDGR